MISETMKSMVANSSVIRAMFEEGKKMAAQYGADHVFDFSLGNPNVPAPACVKEAILDIIEHEDSLYVHGYMSNSGYEEVRQTLAERLNKLYGKSYTAENLLMTVGAAGGLNVIFKALLNPGDEVITVSPYFVEYRSYAGNFGAKLIESPTNPDTFYPDPEDIERKITERTKILILNSPNNPTGVVYPAEVIRTLGGLLRKKEKEFGHPIFIVSDEPYREIAYDDVEVPWIPDYYENAVVGSSYSKSLSLPGERIGYLLIPSEAEDFENLVAACNVANRILGYVNAPSLMQLVVARCADAKTDVEFYDRNRKLLYKSLKDFGYTCTKPDGAFYFWVKSPVEDERAFVDYLKKNEQILVVPGRSFGCAGWVRIAYCVSHETIENSLPGFERTAQYYGL